MWLTHTDTHSVSDFTRFFCTCEFTEIFFQDPTDLHKDQYSAGHKKEESYTSRRWVWTEDRGNENWAPRIQEEQWAATSIKFLRLKKQLPLETDGRAGVQLVPRRALPTLVSFHWSALPPKWSTDYPPVFFIPSSQGTLGFHPKLWIFSDFIGYRMSLCGLGK